uniref:Lipoprotein n=1 Tax=Arundo donax TaxID=35708 RepID=A0A0A9HIE2_ARUDO
MKRAQFSTSWAVLAAGCGWFSEARGGAACRSASPSRRPPPRPGPAGSDRTAAASSG